MATAEDFVLDEQLCFALHAASRAMAGCYRPLLDEIGLTYTQYAVMLVLWERRSVTLGVLCGRLQLDSGTLSPLLKRLEGLGLLTRRRRPEDERTVQVTATGQGMRLRDQAAAAQAQVAVATGLDLAERTEMRAALHVLTRRLRTAAELVS